MTARTQRRAPEQKRHDTRGRAPCGPAQDVIRSPFPRSKLRLTFETLVCRLFRDGLQFCSGLVDLIVGIRHHFRGGHRFTLAGERFVGLVAEDIAEVGDRGGDFRGTPPQRWN